MIIPTIHDALTSIHSPYLLVAGSEPQWQKPCLIFIGSPKITNRGDKITDFLHSIYIILTRSAKITDRCDKITDFLHSIYIILTRSANITNGADKITDFPTYCLPHNADLI